MRILQEKVSFVKYYVVNGYNSSYSTKNKPRRSGEGVHCFLELFHKSMLATWFTAEGAISVPVLRLVSATFVDSTDFLRAVFWTYKIVDSVRIVGTIFVFAKAKLRLPTLNWAERYVQTWFNHYFLLLGIFGFVTESIFCLF